MSAPNVARTVKTDDRMWSLAEIMNARSIAIVGASKAELSELKLTGRPLKFIRMHGFDGEVVAVNPKYDELDGYPCYPTISAIPNRIDVAALMLSKNRTLDAVRECGEKGIKAVAIFSSGFGETGEEGMREQNELVALAHCYGMRVIGPNAAGIVSASNKMVLSFLTAFGQGALPRGSISFASNSGALLSTGVRLADEKGVGFSQLGSIGNESDISLSDFINAGVADSGTSVITAFVESIKDGEGLIASAHDAANAEKPVVVLKVGSSERGGKVAASHTGAITGDDRTMSAVLSQLGITRVRDLTELVDMAALFSRFKTPDVSQAAIISTGSGGAAELMADLCDSYNVELADFDGIKSELAEVLTPFSILVNPIDIAGMTSDFMEEPRLFRSCMEYLLKKPDIGIFGLIIPVLPYMTTLAQHIVELTNAQAKPIIPILTGGGDYPACVEIFKKAGIPHFATADQGAHALKLFQSYTEFQIRNKAAAKLAKPAENQSRKEKAVALLRQHAAKYRSATLHHSAAILELYGLTLPNQRLATNGQEAAAFAKEIGFPVVMKVESPKILHKTEIGGVTINVKTEDAAVAAFDDLMAKAKKAATAEDVDGILIQPMVPYQSEVILGSTRDPSLGHVMVAGLGGVWVELLKDVSMRLPPISKEEAARMINETKASLLLVGYRGKAAGDIDALVQAISNFSVMVSEIGDYIDEFEINPIFVLEKGKGVVVGDALITLNGSI